MGSGTVTFGNMAWTTGITSFCTSASVRDSMATDQSPVTVTKNKPDPGKNFSWSRDCQTGYRPLILSAEIPISLSNQNLLGNWRNILVYVVIVMLWIASFFHEGSGGLKTTSSCCNTPRLNVTKYKAAFYFMPSTRVTEAPLFEYEIVLTVELSIT